MTWFRVDDSFHIHPKVMVAGNSAVGLWVRCGAYSAQLLTDGFIPAQIAATYGEKRDAVRLVEVGLWDAVDGGYRMHDWLQYQPSKADVQERRAEWRERKKSQRESRRDTKGESNGDSRGIPAGSLNGSPGRDSSNRYPFPDSHVDSRRESRRDTPTPPPAAEALRVVPAPDPATKAARAAKGRAVVDAVFANRKRDPA